MRARSILAVTLLIVWLASLLALAEVRGQPEMPPTPPPIGMGGGEYRFKFRDELSPAQYEAIRTEISHNQQLLYQQGKLPLPQTGTPVSFSWPLRWKPGLSDYGYHGVSAFVDHNPAFPNQLLDYNSGDRTYDTASGYNHAGTDYFLWPFGWNKVESNQVEVISAAQGVIVGKSDGNYDHNCSMGNGNWNAVYIQHGDGTVAWYGHMKNGSLTSKPVGNSVVMGEYLGIVASSGNSTGPHLHFEVHDVSARVLDPYKGPSNPITNSLWVAQRAYYDSAINHVATGNAPPEFLDCPNPDISHEQSVFAAGSTIYFVTYYRDQLAGQASQYKIIRPDNSVFYSWAYSSPAAYYEASYWYWYVNFAPNQPLGTWRFQVTYQGQTYQTPFDVIAQVPMSSRLYLPITIR